MAKRGRKPKDNLHKVRLMMRLIEEGMDVKPSSQAVDPDNSEGLRRKYYRLRETGRLPEAAPVPQKTIKHIAGYFELSQRLEIEKRERLAAARKRLVALGYDPEEEDRLRSARDDLLAKSRKISTLLNSGQIIADLLEMGIKTEKAMLKTIEEMTVKKERMDKRLDALTEYLKVLGGFFGQ